MSIKFTTFDLPKLAKQNTINDFQNHQQKDSNRKLENKCINYFSLLRSSSNIPPQIDGSKVTIRKS